MATQHANLFAELSAPFEDGRLKTRPGGNGRTLTFITARTAANRLDEVVGPENWRNSFDLQKLADDSDVVVCTIEIRVGDEWIARQDAGGFKQMTEKDRSGTTVDDDENTVKTGFSDAFKRAAAMWGIARYLYNDGGPRFNVEREPGSDDHTPAAHDYQAPQPQRRDDPPQAPPRPHQGNGQSQNGGERRGNDSPPRSGKALFAWTRKTEERFGPGLLNELNDRGKAKGFPNRMVDWTESQVAEAYAGALQILAKAGHQVGA